MEQCGHQFSEEILKVSYLLENTKRLYRSEDLESHNSTDDISDLSKDEALKIIENKIEEISAGQDVLSELSHPKSNFIMKYLSKKTISETTELHPNLFLPE